MAIIVRVFAAFFLIFSAVTMVYAQEILMVQVEREGEISQSISFTQTDLREIGMHLVKTENSYVDGMKTFAGPLVRDLVAKLGVEDLRLGYMIAENDYTVEISMREFFDYDVILALSMDGVELSPRDKGPIWVIYPMSAHKKLQEPKYDGRLIWQLDRIVFR